jgi:opacity protein-like surface antigen
MNSNMHHAIAALAAVAVAIGATTPTADAQRAASKSSASAPARKSTSTLGDRTKGLMLGVYSLAAPGVAITGEDVDGTFGTSFGPGAGVMLGYGFNRIWTAYASLDVAKQSTAPGTFPEGSLGLAHFELGARANLPVNHEKILPYVTAAVGNRALGGRVYDEEWDEYADETLSGTMFALGGGAQYFLSPTMALDGGVSLGLGSFGKWTQDGDSETADVNSTKSLRLRAGVTWRPGVGAHPR